MSISLLHKSCFSIRCIQFSSILLHYTPVCKRYSSSKLNPLYNIHEIPQYQKIDGDAITSAIPELINNVKNDYKTFEASLLNQKDITWENIFPISENITDKIGLAWSAVQHLNGVRNSEDLRDAYKKVQPDIVALFSALSQSKPVYDAIECLNKSPENLDEAQLRIIESSLRSARNSGVHLEGELKEDFNKIIQELAGLNTKFVNNVLDSTKDFSYIIHDEKEMHGVPQSVKVLMASNYARVSNQTADPDKGPWKLSLDIPCFQPFMKHSLNGNLREKVYKAYIQRASYGSFDNTAVIEQIRSLRKKKSKILGFDNYAELSLNSKMAKSPLAVWNLINQLKEKAKPAAYKELEQLKNFAKDKGHDAELNHWDLPFWSERQRENLFNLEEEKLRQYFPFSQVLKGLFQLSQELFGISITECPKSSFETWNEEVRFFNISDQNGAHIASFFLDPYSRPQEKNGGAWMDVALGYDEDLGRKPIAYLVCNQSPPIGDLPSLMTFNEVNTLFHEFGHGLQHMLTSVRYPSAAGINNIEWDAVELPSQFMENWLYDWNTIQRVSGHYKTGQVLPRDMFDQILKERKYQAGLTMMRQLYFSALDMELHSTDDDWRSVMSKIANEYSVLQPLKKDSFPCSFQHIFGGGYAAGYFSYKWAEVLSSDAFSIFEAAGLENRDKIQQLGKRFRGTILSQGGGRHPENVFVDFVGRKPDITALMKSYGLS